MKQQVLIFLALTGLGMIAVLINAIRATIAFRRDLDRQDRRLNLRCPECGYPRIGRFTGSKCPECGADLPDVDESVIRRATEGETHTDRREPRTELRE